MTKQIVPYEALLEWEFLAEQERMNVVDYVANRAAAWALEQAVQICGRVAFDYDEQSAPHHMGGAETCADEIRALMAGTGGDDGQ